MKPTQQLKAVFATGEALKSNNILLKSVVWMGALVSKVSGAFNKSESI